MAKIKVMCVTCSGTGIIPEDSKILDGPYATCDTCFGEGQTQEDNPVNSPKHYTYGTYEVIDVIEDWGLDKDFCLGNTIKYIARARHKGNELEDLKKAQWYLNRKISNIELEIAAGDDE